MTTITCDLCDKVIETAPLQVQLRDDDPGSTGCLTVDCCLDCIFQIPGLSSQANYDTVLATVKQRKELFNKLLPRTIGKTS